MWFKLKVGQFCETIDFIHNLCWMHRFLGIFSLEQRDTYIYIFSVTIRHIVPCALFGFIHVIWFVNICWISLSMMKLSTTTTIKFPRKIFIGIFLDVSRKFKNKLRITRFWFIRVSTFLKIVSSFRMHVNAKRNFFFWKTFSCVYERCSMLKTRNSFEFVCLIKKILGARS